jgi:uncharacterized protein (TIGR02646 family)
MRRPADERRQRRAPLNEDIFHDSELVREVQQLFRGKCAFCEALVPSPLIRHFRPLQFAEPTYGVDTTHYYAWLAFEWQNMLLVCDVCEKTKSTLFPMQRGGRSPYLARYDDIREQEYPLLLDPCADDPRRHMQFLSDGSCVHKTERGAATIHVLDLNRDDLLRSRRHAMERWLDMLTGGQERFVEEVRGTWQGSSFNLGAEHLGASLSVLRTILTDWRGTSSRDVAAIPSFLRNVSDEIRDASSDERRDLARIVEETRASDASRGRALRDAIARSQIHSDPADADRRRRIVLDAHDREIAKITISHVKAIDHLEIEMDTRRSGAAGAPCLAILGENSTGKSTVLSAIALALIGSKQARRLKLGPSHLLSSSGIERLDLLDAESARVEIDFHYLDKHATFSLDPETERVDGQPEQMTVVLAYGPRRYFSPRYRNRPEGARHRVKTLFDPLATIPYPNDWLTELPPDSFDTVARALRIVLALNDEDHLISDPEEGMCVEANGRRTPVEWLSEGYKSVFAMVVDIIRELLDHYGTLEQARGIVLIDEIETHLHPRWKMQIMTSLRKALPGVQFIVTTHDPLCLRGMDDNEVIVLQRTEEAKIRRVANLPSVRGMSAEQLLTSEYFGLLNTVDPRLEVKLAMIKGDVVTTDGVGGQTVTLSAQTEELLKSVTVTGSPSEMIIEDALKGYLADHESKRGKLPDSVRNEAVEAVMRALAAPSAG